MIKMFVRLLVVLGITGLVAACSGSASTPTPTTTANLGGPLVIINAPASNSDFQVGDNIAVKSTSTSASGVVLVELSVDGKVVVSSPTPNSQPQTQFSVIQNYLATEGKHTLTVRATDNRATTADAAIIVNVSGGSGVPTAAPPPTQAEPTAGQTTPVPVTAVPVTAVAPTAPPSTCTLNSTFIADVTIPDGTTIAPNSAFVKTWAVQNSGSCAWGPGYNFVFTGGTQMNAPSPSPLPSTQPGETINYSLNMIAPPTPGQYRGTWQMQAPNGSLFGTKLDVLINVPGGPPPTPVPPTPPPAACNGVPQITSFTANPTNIQNGQNTTLRWGQVLNATSVALSSPQGNGGVATPGEIVVSPGNTTTYTLIAYCYNNSVQAQVTVNVNNVKPPTPTPQPSQGNQIQNMTVSKSGDTYTVTVRYFWNGEDSPANMEAVGVNKTDDPATNRAERAIIAGFVKNVTLTLTGKDAVKIDACMIGRSGQELVCSSANVP